MIRAAILLLAMTLALSACGYHSEMAKRAALEATLTTPEALRREGRAIVVGKIIMANRFGARKPAADASISFMGFTRGADGKVKFLAGDYLSAGPGAPVYDRITLPAGSYAINRVGGTYGGASVSIPFAFTKILRPDLDIEVQEDLVVAAGEVVYIGDILFEIGAYKVASGKFGYEYSFSARSDIEAARIYLAKEAPDLAPLLQERLLVCSLCSTPK